MAVEEQVPDSVFGGVGQELDQPETPMLILHCPVISVQTPHLYAGQAGVEDQTENLLSHLLSGLDLLPERLSTSWQYLLEKLSDDHDHT